MSRRESCFKTSNNKNAFQNGGVSGGGSRSFWSEFHELNSSRHLHTEGRLVSCFWLKQTCRCSMLPAHIRPFAKAKCDALIETFATGDPPMFSRAALLSCVQAFSGHASPGWFRNKPERIFEHLHPEDPGVAVLART